MSPTFDPTRLPAHLPAPADDGAAEHLGGRAIPSLVLPSTKGAAANLAELARATLVLYIHPQIARPDRPLPEDWDATPGARGCTPQSCAFRDRSTQFSGLGVKLAGLAAQSEEDQAEAAVRLKLPFPLLSDPQLRLARELDLPTFEIAGMRLYKRLTLIARHGRIVKVFYPVFRPDQNAAEVAAWLGHDIDPRSEA